jgi:hypothetical protein
MDPIALRAQLQTERIVVAPIATANTPIREAGPGPRKECLESAAGGSAPRVRPVIIG